MKLNIHTTKYAKFMHQFIFILLALGSLFFGCSNSKLENKITDVINQKNQINITYPFNKTLFPPEIPAPDFEWQDSLNKTLEYHVFVSDTLGNVLISANCDNPNWTPGIAEWHLLKRENKKLLFTVFGEKQKNKSTPSGQIEFSFSSDSVGADIFFRAVPLPFSFAVKNVNTIEWYMGKVDGSKPRKMLDNLPVCGNCHSFATKQPLLAMDVDYGNDKGSYIISESKDTSNLSPDKIITWSDYKREDKDPTFGLLSQISPDGNHVLSTVKDISIFAAVDNNMAYSQLFFPIKGIVGIYDRINNKFDELEGANNPEYVQSNPTWSPDGNTVVFARSKMYINEKLRNAGKALLSIKDVDEFVSREQQFKYDLFTVDFNDGNGGEASPLPGASYNGKSNYFPKYSPDGKWIVFCQAENFMLLQPDSRLYIMPSIGGTPRLMNCNMTEMNSWHSWSPNGKWLVFSSKNKGMYTQLYLTHIDEDGMDSPPVLLKNLVFKNRAANIPEFYPFNADHFKKIQDNFSNTAEYYNRGAFDKITNKYFIRAYADVNKALELDSLHLESYFNRIMLNGILHQSNSLQDRNDKNIALKIIQDSLTAAKSNVDYLALKISILSAIGELNEAEKLSKTTLQSFPNNYKIYELLASLHKKNNQLKQAFDCYKKMLLIDKSKEPELKIKILDLLIQQDKHNEAIKAIDQYLSQNENDPILLTYKCRILMDINAIDQAKQLIDKLLEQNENNHQNHELIAQYYQFKGNKRLLNFHKQKVIEILAYDYKENPENMDVAFNLASKYLVSKNFKKAEIIYKDVLNHLPWNYEALRQMAKIKLNNQNWHEAIAIYNILEKYYPLEEGFCNNKAIAYIQIGAFKKAVEYFNKTLEINPYNRDAKYNRNKLLKEYSF